MNPIYTELCSIFLLLFVLIDYYNKNPGRTKCDSCLWYLECLSILVLSVVNILIYIFKETNFQNIFIVISYIIMIVPILIHLIYINKNYMPKERSVLSVKYLVIYFILYTIVVICSFIDNSLFNANFLFYILTIIPVIYFNIKIMINKITFERRIYYLILLPAIGGLIDTIFSASNFLTFFYSLSALYIYILIHDMAINKDSLTGANNRRYLDSYVYLNDKKYAVYMIDIDDFKKTNDTYGHDKGDIVLKDLVEILKSSVRTTDSVIRTGGDEFVIIAAMKNDNDIKVIYNRIKDNIKKYNNENKIKISLSIGYDLYSSHLNFNVFLDNIDKKMYKSKKAKKRKYEKENN